MFLVPTKTQYACNETHRDLHYWMLTYQQDSLSTDSEMSAPQEKICRPNYIAGWFSHHLAFSSCKLYLKEIGLEGVDWIMIVYISIERPLR
jgi:hypothetical protein